MLRTIGRTTDVEPGHVRAFKIRDGGAEAVGRSRIPILRAIGAGRSRGTQVTLANVAGTFFAIDDTCTHRGCSLGDGKLDGSTVQCACHGSRFDVNPYVVSGFGLALLLLAGGMGIAIRQSRKTTLSPA